MFNMFRFVAQHSTSCRAMMTVLFLSSLFSSESFRASHFRAASLRSSNLPLYSSPISETPKSMSQPLPGSIMTLSRFMIEATRSNPDHADFESLMASIQIACKTIANLVSRVGISDLTGLQSSKSPGEELKTLKSTGTESGTTATFGNSELTGSLHEMANTVLKNVLRFTGKIGVVLPTSDGDQPLLIEEAWNSKYVTIFKALDGASNIDVGIVTGTIFSIYKETEECLVDFGEEVSEEGEILLLKTLIPKKNLVASGYCMYSSSTVLMFSMGNGVHGFTLDPNIGEFVLTHPNVRIPRRGRIYSLNEANALKWSRGLQQYVSDIKTGKGELKLSYTARYIGSMVGDLHRTLLYGGIFGYPSDSKRPKGKLRLLQEVSPLSFLVEQAGGKASTGTGNILDVIPQDLHEHVPCLMGSMDDVTEAEKYIKKLR